MTSKFLEYKEEITKASKALSDAKLTLFKLQADYRFAYRKEIIRHYLTMWEKSDRFPKDQEFLNAVFHLANLPISDPEETQPQIKQTLDKDHNYHISYYNIRLAKWVEISLPSDPVPSKYITHTKFFCDDCTWTSYKEKLTCPSCGSQNIFRMEV
jgi:hypothetical protein